MEKKMTKRDYFGELKKLVADRTDLVEFIDHELELLDKKASSSKMTKTQVENEGLMENILEKMVELGSPITVTDLVVAFDNKYTNNIHGFSGNIATTDASSIIFKNIYTKQKT